VNFRTNIYKYWTPVDINTLSFLNSTCLIKTDVFLILFKMPTSELESSSSSWKSSSPALSLASSLNGTPPSCPTPDYDTSSSSSVSSPAVSLSTISRNLASQGKHSSSSQTSVNTHSKPVLNTQSRPPATNVDKTTTATSQTNPKNADAVEMQSIESFRLKNPQSPKPKPPETYFVPAKSKNKTQNSR
jgi:hypothetical protein